MLLSLWHCSSNACRLTQLDLIKCWHRSKGCHQANRHMGKRSRSKPFLKSRLRSHSIHFSKVSWVWIVSRKSVCFTLTRVLKQRQSLSTQHMAIKWNQIQTHDPAEWIRSSQKKTFLVSCRPILIVVLFEPSQEISSTVNLCLAPGGLRRFESQTWIPGRWQIYGLSVGEVEMWNTDRWN